MHSGVFINLYNDMQQCSSEDHFLSAFEPKSSHSPPPQVRYCFRLPNSFYLITQRVCDLMVTGITPHHRAPITQMPRD